MVKAITERLKRVRMNKSFRQVSASMDNGCTMNMVLMMAKKKLSHFPNTAGGNNEGEEDDNNADDDDVVDNEFLRSENSFYIVFNIVRSILHVVTFHHNSKYALFQ